MFLQAATVRCLEPLRINTMLLVVKTWEAAADPLLS